MPALTGTGSKPPAAITVLHSCGSFAIVWHIADVQTALMNVRFEGNNGHDADGNDKVMSANDTKAACNFSA